MNDNIDGDYNVLGFTSYIENEKRHYGCRGRGKDYKDFYHQFIVGKSYKLIASDFPWSYFIFTDIKDEQLFLKKYSTLIHYIIQEN